MYHGREVQSAAENEILRAVTLHTLGRGITVKPVFKTTWEIGTTWELRTAISVPRYIHYIEIDLRNKTTSEFRTVFDTPLGVPNYQVLK